MANEKATEGRVIGYCALFRKHKSKVYSDSDRVTQIRLGRLSFEIARYVKNTMSEKKQVTGYFLRLFNDSF